MSPYLAELCFMLVVSSLSQASLHSVSLDWHCGLGIVLPNCPNWERLSQTRGWSFVPIFHFPLQWDWVENCKHKRWRSGVEIKFTRNSNEVRKQTLTATILIIEILWKREGGSHAKMLNAFHMQKVNNDRQLSLFYHVFLTRSCTLLLRSHGESFFPAPGKVGLYH